MSLFWFFLYVLYICTIINVNLARSSSDPIQTTDGLFVGIRRNRLVVRLGCTIWYQMCKIYKIHLMFQPSSIEQCLSGTHYARRGGDGLLTVNS
jgi:hypothetical protein